MNKEQIIQDWLLDSDNRDKLPTIQYDTHIYNFIINNADKYSYKLVSDFLPIEDIYYFNGIYQKIACKND